MLDFIATFFLIVASLSIVATYMYTRTPEPEIGYPAKAPAIYSFGLAFALLAAAGALMFAD
ncbi:MAG: hypothetical protein M0R03_14365 [Novosphingobium sp.]|nr:hypothetical protein [Novosphingobium sp.]